MSRIYNNWERLVDAALKKEQLWQLFHAQSRSPSITSDSSGLTFSLAFTSSSDDASFTFSPPVSDRDGDDGGNPSRILVKEQPPAKIVTLTTSARKRDLRIQVPKPLNHHYGVFSPRIASPVHFSRLHPTDAEGTPVSDPPANWPNDDAKQRCHPLPLPPEAIPKSPQISHPKSVATSPSSPLPSTERACHKSPWKRGKLLSKGAVGNVYLGFNSEKGKMCAVKEFIPYSDKAKLEQSARRLEKESAILSSLKHPNIMSYYGFEVAGDILYSYYEYISGGSLHSILQQYGKLGESAIRRDIRGANIFVDPNGVVKLSNFGIEKQLTAQFHPSALLDNSYWMAPEVIINLNSRSRAIDIWSLGCTVVEMATSKPPLSQYGEGVALFKTANHREHPTIPDHLSDKGKDFLRRCFQWDPLRRATAHQLLEHPFVKSSSPVAKQVVVSKSNFTPSNISTPVSTVSSPLPHPRSPQISSPATPKIVGNCGAFVYPLLNPSALRPENFGCSPKHSPTPTIVNSPAAYWDPNILRGLHSPSDNDSQLTRAAGASRRVNQQSALADRVKSNQSVDWNPVNYPLTKNHLAGV